MQTDLTDRFFCNISPAAINRCAFNQCRETPQMPIWAELSTVDRALLKVPGSDAVWNDAEIASAAVGLTAATVVTGGAALAVDVEVDVFVAAPTLAY